MEEQSQTKRVQHTMCYVFFLAIAIYFLEPKKDEQLMKHIRYSLSFFAVYILVGILLYWLFSPILVTFLYLGAMIFLAYRAYIGEDITIQFIDDFFKEQTK